MSCREPYSRPSVSGSLHKTLDHIGGRFAACPRADFSRWVTPSTQRAFQLFRIGDAVSSRNIHAAIFDGLRLLKDI